MSAGSLRWGFFLCVLLRTLFLEFVGKTIEGGVSVCFIGIKSNISMDEGLPETLLQLVWLKCPFSMTEWLASS